MRWDEISDIRQKILSLVEYHFRLGNKTKNLSISCDYGNTGKPMVRRWSTFPKEQSFKTETLIFLTRESGTSKPIFALSHGIHFWSQQALNSNHKKQTSNYMVQEVTMFNRFLDSFCSMTIPSTILDMAYKYGYISEFRSMAYLDIQQPTNDFECQRLPDFYYFHNLKLHSSIILTWQD